MKILIFIGACALVGWAFLALHNSDPETRRKKREAKIIEQICHLPGTWEGESDDRG